MAGLGKFRREDKSDDSSSPSEASTSTGGVSSTYYSHEFTSTPEPEDSDVDDVEDIDDESPEAVLRASERQRLAAADALKSWIEIENPTNYKILERLEKDIRNNRQLNEWGSFSLDDLLRPPSPDFSKLKYAKVGHWVTIARNLFLFAPVLVTWTAIERAASAYHNTSSTSETFLNIWGKQYWSLSRVATWDAAIIALLIFLTLGSHLLEGRADAVARRMDDEADERFRDVMVEVGLFLHGFRQITPAALKGGLADAVNQLKEATTAMNDTAVSMSEVADRAATTLGEFAVLSAKEFAPAAERLATLAETLEKTTSAHAEMNKLVTGLQDNLSSTIGKMSDEVDGMTSSIVEQLEKNASVLSATLSLAAEKLEMGGHKLEVATVAASAAVEEIAVARTTLKGR